MPNNTPPTAPESLPKYLAEGIPKQDEPTLEDSREYIEALIQYREQAVGPAELPDTAEPVDSPGEPATVVLETVRCGDDSCHCSDPDGPYLYRYQYDGDAVQSEYIGKPENHPGVETT